MKTKSLIFETVYLWGGLEWLGWTLEAEECVECSNAQQKASVSICMDVSSTNYNDQEIDTGSYIPKMLPNRNQIAKTATQHIVETEYCEMSF